MPGETFGTRFKSHRENIKDAFGRILSQEKAARLFDVSLSTIRGWEKDRSLPDERSRLALGRIWPDFFL